MKKFMYTAVVILGMALYVFSQENYSTWGYYRTIILNTKISGANVDSLVKNFPVLVRLNATNAPDVFTQSSASGNDIRFAGMNGSHLNYQKVLWDTTNKKAYFWVLADSVAASDSLAAFKMFWGKSGAADSSKASIVFDTTVANGGGYQAVFHMSNGLTDNDTDATMNKFIAIPTGTSVDSAAGMTGHSRQFDGTATYFTVQNSATSKLSILDSADYTLSAWAFSDTAPIGTSSRETMIAKFGITTGTTGMGEYKMGITQGVTPFTTAKWEVGAWYNSSASGKRNVYCASPAAVPVAHAWHHVVGTQNRGNFALYVDGVLSSSTYASGSGTKSVTYDVTIGATAGITSQFFKGKLQELRIENVARGAKFIKLAYQNQFVPTGAASDSLVILGASQTLVTPPIAPVLTAPANNTTGIAVAPTLTWGTVAGAATYRVQVSTASDFNTIVTDDSTLTSATKTLTTTLNNNTTYYWRVNASNTGATSAWSTAFSFTFTIVGIRPATPNYVSAGIGHSGVLEVYLANGSRVMQIAYSAVATKAQLLNTAYKSLAKGYYTYRFRSVDAKIEVVGKLIK